MDTFDDGDQEFQEKPAPYKPQEIDIEEETKLQAQEAGENFHRYKEQRVTCIPLDLVKPIDNFSDVIESQLLLKNVSQLGYTEMTPIQKWAMPAILNGYDIIGCAQTGSGKTAAFLLPILQTLMKSDLGSHDPDSDCQNPYCLIISPTRELANQLHTNAQMLSRDSMVKCRVIIGQVQTAHLKAKLSQGCHILVATIGRLKDFVERGWIGFKNIKYIILDEGDRLVDQSGFMGDIQEIFNHASMPPKEERQTLFFSATFKPDIQTNAKEFLRADNYVFMAVGRVGAANEDIKQEFIVVSQSEKKRELKKILSSVPESEKTIVFTQTKAIADMLAAWFTSNNLSSTSIHGDRHQSQREQAITAFKRGEKRFLISSPVGNRGLDLPKVALVINYDLPPNIDEYVHRIGRTGRAGHKGRAISFFNPDKDRDVLDDLLKILEEAKQEVPDWMKDGNFPISTNTSSGGFGGGSGSWATSGADDGWADSGNSAAKTSGNDGWGDSGSSAAKTSGNDGWGDSGSSAAKTSGNDGWGDSGSSAAKTSGNDGWGDSGNSVAKTSANDGWGNEATTSSTAKVGSDDGCGSKATKDNDSTGQKAGSDGWGSWSGATSSGSNDQNTPSSSWNSNGNSGGSGGWGGSGGYHRSEGSDRGQSRGRSRGNFRGGRDFGDRDGGSGSWGGSRSESTDSSFNNGYSSWGDSGGRPRGRGGFRGKGGFRGGRGGGGGSSWGAASNDAGGWGQSSSSWSTSESSNNKGTANNAESSGWGSGGADDGWGSAPSGKRSADEPAGNRPKRQDSTTNDDWGSGWS